MWREMEVAPFGWLILLKIPSDEREKYPRREAEGVVIGAAL